VAASFWVGDNHEIPRHAALLAFLVVLSHALWRAAAMAVAGRGGVLADRGGGLALKTAPAHDGFKMPRVGGDFR